MEKTRRLPLVGLALTLVGLALAVGFWPLTSVSGADLLASKRADPHYAGYAPGSRITIREKVLSVSDTGFLGGTTTLELDDGDTNQATVIYVQGDATNVVQPNEIIYTSAVLTVFAGPYPYYYWDVASPQDVHPSWPIDAVFYGIMAAGVATLVVAAFRKP